MHILGKVLLWFSIPLVITAVVFTTMLLDIRSNWKAKLDTSLQAAQQSADTLRVEKAKTAALTEELINARHSWGDAWTAANGNRSQGENGAIEIGVGSGKGLGQKAQALGKPLPNVFLFAHTSPEEAQFLGEFKLSELRIDSATCQITRTLYPGEEEGWEQLRGVYHVRDTIPFGWISAISELDGQILIAQRHLEVQREQLKTLNEEVIESEESLAQRKAELNGDPDAPQGAEQEVVDGLVETVRRLETERNAVLANVDVLRHDLNDKYVLLRETMDANTSMTKKIADAAGSASVQPRNGVGPALTVRPQADRE
ncbi:MAG: hypothetical protein KDA88_13770 [Planctomycetaceae bacterium]|nr:hypothetical protein [Planctomycetaceae bacterium]MCB9951708.1 hypothetical protein [Planctomycetaceae bacterium]